MGGGWGGRGEGGCGGGGGMGGRGRCGWEVGGGVLGGGVEGGRTGGGRGNGRRGGGRWPGQEKRGAQTNMPLEWEREIYQQRVQGNRTGNFIVRGCGGERRRTTRRIDDPGVIREVEWRDQEVMQRQRLAEIMKAKKDDECMGPPRRGGARDVSSCT